MHSRSCLRQTFLPLGELSGLRSICSPRTWVGGAGGLWAVSPCLCLPQTKQCWSGLTEDALGWVSHSCPAGHLSPSGGRSCLLSPVLPPRTWSSVAVTAWQHWVFCIFMQLPVPDLG